MIKTYGELISLPTFIDRYRYLRCAKAIGEQTFGSHRYLNQRMYQRSKEWKRAREYVIIRDDGCDLACPERSIEKPNIIYVHHINPITVEDIMNDSPSLFDPNNLICCSYETHQAIHYGNEDSLPSYFVNERKPNDTCPWRK